MLDRRYIHLLWLPLLGYLLALFYRLAWFDEITSIANDSVNYLVMARYYSPWVPVSEAIQAAWPLQDFPPLFPLLLALSGAAHSLLAAHVLVIVMGLLSLILLYRLAVRWLGNIQISTSGAAMLAVVVFSISPGYILGLQGILSESLYLLLSLLFLLLYNDQSDHGKSWLAGLALLLAFIILTRTIGWALWLAVLLQAIVSSIAMKKIQYRRLFLIAGSLVVYLVFQWWLGPDRESHYLSVVTDFIGGNFNAGESAGLTVLLAQVRSLLEAWQTFWAIYWIDEVSASYVIVSVLLVFALLELFSRLRSNKVDAYYVLIYLGILFMWPHPGQMVRLMLPIAALLILYAVIYAVRLLRRTAARDKIWAHYGLVGLLLATIVPSHAFIYGRLNLAETENLIPVYEIFRKPDSVRAQYELRVQNQIFSDMRALRYKVREREIVMYAVPAYMSVLSGRKSVPYSSVNARSQQKNNFTSEYIFVTAIHPRKAREGYSGFTAVPELGDLYKEVWCSRLENNEPASCFYKINR